MSVSQNERERAVHRSRKMYQTDLMSDFATAEDRGRREGMREGRREGIAAVVRNMLRRGLSAEEIAALTGLSTAEVEAIRREAR